MKRLRHALVLLCAVALNAAEPAGPDLALRPDAEGFIRDWLLLGPLPLPQEGAPSDPILQAHLPNEATLSPRIGERVSVGPEERMWRAVRAPGFLFDFNEQLGGTNHSSIGYLVARVVSPEAKTNLVVLAGCNDQSRLFLNGREVAKRLEAGPLAKDELRAEKIALQTGVNTVVFKVINEQNNWQACLRFVDAAGKPVPGLTLRLQP